MNFFSLDLSQFKEQYDFIIIGGGSAGCAIANRLSENKKWSILLIEAGKEEDWLTDVPIIAPILSTTDYVWGYKTEKEKNMYWGTNKMKYWFFLKKIFFFRKN